MDKYFPAFKPSLDQASKELLVECIEQSAISGNYGQHLNYMESYYQNTHRNYYPVTCSSGTTALHLACLGLGMTSRHTVVVPATTNMATFFAPMYIGAKVISCDVDAKSGLISIQALENICKTEKIDFAIIVHLYGHVCDCKKLRNLSIKYNFKIIEDCAEAHFAELEPNVYSGSYFDAGCLVCK